MSRAHKPSERWTPEPDQLRQDPDAIKWAMDAKLWTQSKLAKHLGISESLLSEILSGKRSASAQVLHDLAVALNCPVTMLERKRQPAASEQVA